MEKANLNNFKNLYLVGFMGVGKSFFGRLVAKKLALGFFDSDREIEKSENASISKIFESKGEDYFRRLEREFIEKGHPKFKCVVSCGGGLPIQTGMMPLLKSKGVVISLFASTEMIVKRTEKSKKRPLLNVDNYYAKINELLLEREPIYLLSNCSISIEGRKDEDVVSNIVRAYKKYI